MRKRASGMPRGELWARAPTASERSRWPLVWLYDTELRVVRRKLTTVQGCQNCRKVQNGRSNSSRNWNRACSIVLHFLTSPFQNLHRFLSRSHRSLHGRLQRFCQCKSNLPVALCHGGSGGLLTRNGEISVPG